MSQFKTTQWSLSVVGAADLLDKHGYKKLALNVEELAQWILTHLSELEKIDVPKTQHPKPVINTPAPAGPRCWSCTAALKFPTDACPRCGAQVVDYNGNLHHHLSKN